MRRYLHDPSDIDNIIIILSKSSAATSRNNAILHNTLHIIYTYNVDVSHAKITCKPRDNLCAIYVLRLLWYAIDNVWSLQFGTFERFWRS